MLTLDMSQLHSCEQETQNHADGKEGMGHSDIRDVLQHTRLPFAQGHALRTFLELKHKRVSRIGLPSTGTMSFFL